MSVIAVMDVSNFKILTVRTVSRLDMRHRTKFRSDRFSHCCDMAILRFFKMATAAVLDFFKIQNFNGRKGQEGQTASTYQILCRAVKRLL